MKLTAKTLYGLEELLAKELTDLGAQNINVVHRAVEFEGDMELLYRANLELRTAIRILKPIRTLRVRDEDELYRKIQGVDWSEYMDVRDTLAIDGVSSSRIFTHSKYIALKTKDAIVDQFRDKFGRRPNVNVYNPTLRINVRILDDLAYVSIDSSGDSLHKRGYRMASVEAPINEVLAAGLVLHSGWKKDCDFIDPMCGSGTILIEAALYAYNIAPNLLRESFGFMKWKDYDAALWSAVVQQAKEKTTNFEHRILGSDKDLSAVRKTEANATEVGLEDKIEVQRKPFERLTPPEGKGIIIVNPPYDERLQSDDIKAFYTMMGDRFKKEFTGFEAWLISSNMEALKKIGLRASRKINLLNGKLECKFLKFELYAGSRKQKKMES